MHHVIDDTNAFDGRRGREVQPLAQVGTAVTALVALGWVVMVVVYLRPPIALSPDSMNNYAHVWWISQHLWHGGGIPWSMPVLGHGDAITFPYGSINWTLAALLHPLGGDRVTGVVTVLGALGSILATFVAFPELRRGWWAAAVLVDVPLLRMLLVGQQSFAWAAMLGLFGVAAWRRDRPLLAAVLVGLAQANHAAVALPIGVVGVAVAVVVRSDRARIARWYALSLCLSAPAAVAVLGTSAYEDSSARDRLVNFFTALAPRTLVLAVPLGFVWAARRFGERAAPVAFAVSLLVHVALFVPLEERMGWRTFTRTPAAASAEEFVHSPEFRPDATLRFLRGSDSKLGRYIALRAGAHLDSEFFPESEAIRDFGSRAEYESLLCARRIDSVVVFHSYDSSRGTNEHAWLERMARGGPGRVVVHRVEGGSAYDVYTVVRTGC